MKPSLLKETLAEILGPFPNRGKVQTAAEKLLSHLRRRKIIIYGGGALGRLLAKTLGHHQMEVAFYVDRAAEKIIRLGEVPVFEPRHLAGADANHIVLVAANLKTQYEKLAAIVRQQNAWLAILDGFAVNRVLRFALCGKQLEDQLPFDLIQCENCGYEGRGCSFCLSYLRKAAEAKFLDPEWRSMQFDWFGYIVGQSCTLKCIHCCEAVPYLKEHSFVDLDTIVSDVSAVARSSRFLKFVELIGGEPFLHPDFERLLISLLGIKNIGYIKMFTNGTVVPSDSLCRILKNNRIMLQMSNYEHQVSGRLLDNIMATRQKLAEQGIRYVFAPHPEWLDFSSFDLHHTDEKKPRRAFHHCQLMNCHRLYRGVLFRCPHQYAGIQLGELEKHPVECLDIHNLDARGLAEALTDFENVEYIDACRYCLLPFDAPVVPAGEQLRRQAPVLLPNEYSGSPRLGVRPPHPSPA
jgi:organic radical activating enzyme